MNGTNNSSQAFLIDALRNPSLYPHEVAGFELVETHISWVLLTGSYAYKIKKAVDLGFLDFSTLEKRHHYCLEELRLNRRTAPDIYVDVVPVTGTADRPALGGNGPTIEYAVKMVQFPRDALLSDRLVQGRLTKGELDDLARTVARFHRNATAADSRRPFGKPETVHGPMVENFRQITEHPGTGDIAPEVERIRQWTEARYTELAPLIERRRTDGFVRECHGDLHLGNIVALNHRPTPFDCIEFSNELRWIDTVSEIAFLVMDLEDRDRPDLAARFLNRWLEENGDYQGLPLLAFYKTYRAMVRAKVTTIRLGQDDTTDRERTGLLRELHQYVALALGYTRPPRPFLAITRGVSGSGKTWGTQRLLERTAAVRLRSDIERKRLFGLAPGEGSGSRQNEGIYTSDATRRTYDRLACLAGEVLRAGIPCIVDATFLDGVQRGLFRGVAEREGVPFRILDFAADPDRLRRRIRKRASEASDASEADVAVMERQVSRIDPLSEDEKVKVLRVNTDHPASLESAYEALSAVQSGCSDPVH